MFPLTWLRDEEQTRIYPFAMPDHDASDGGDGEHGSGEDGSGEDGSGEHGSSDHGSSDHGDLLARVPWEWPEVLGVAILVSLGLLVLGGLGSGIALSTRQAQYVVPNTIAWDAIQNGTGWATPYFAVVLLAVIGGIWWVGAKWRADADPDERIVRHLRRSRAMKKAALCGLALVAFGAALGLVATIEENRALGAGVQATSVDIASAANAAAALVLAAVGVWACAKLDRAIVSEGAGSPD